MASAGLVSAGLVSAGLVSDDLVEEFLLEGFEFLEVFEEGDTGVESDEVSVGVYGTEFFVYGELILAVDLFDSFGVEGFEYDEFEDPFFDEELVFVVEVVCLSVLDLLADVVAGLEVLLD